MKTKFSSLLYCLLFVLFSKAQTTITTANGTTGYTGSRFLSTNSAITFVVENTNNYPIFLNDIDMFKSASYPANPSRFTLWRSASSLSGNYNIVKPTWDSVYTTQQTNTALGYNNIFSNLGLIIPAHAQYRFAIQSNNGIAFSGVAAGSCSPSILTASGVNLILGDALIGTDYVGAAGGMPQSFYSPAWFTGAITFVQANNCSGTPIAGNAIASATQGCLGNDFLLTLSGSTQAVGLKYQWDSSGNGTTWTPMINDTTKIIIQSQVATSYYRCRVSCGSNTSTSSTVALTTPAPVSGNFTINANGAAALPNFRSFADAINYIACGINGPVVLNVIPGSGPYNEHLAIPQIGGSSAANSITIKGNGETINFDGATNSDKSIVLLDGADYVTLDSLTIDATLSSYGWGILLTNAANHNVIKNCTINCNANSISSNYMGIISSGSTNFGSFSGDNANDILVQNNTINGGYYSINFFGDMNNNTTNNNIKIIGNTVKDFYGYSIAANYISKKLLISKNDVSRPNRTNSGNVCGIYLGSNCWEATVEKNRIHNMFDAAPSSTSAFYGLYLGGDGTTAIPNRVINNLVYNISGNGSQIGILNAASDTIQILHNTIALNDNTASIGYTTGFSVSGAVTGVVFRNNIVSVTRSGSGVKRCIAFPNATSSVVSNNNSLYFSTTGTNPQNSFGQYGVQNPATLADWQAINGGMFDQQSVEGDPAFVDATNGDLTPTYPNINDIGLSQGVIDDVDGNLRNPSPDPGAIEFTISPCLPPVTAGSVVSVTNICSGNNLGLSLAANSFGAGQTYLWQRSSTGVNGTWVDVQPKLTNPNISTTQSASYWYRCLAQCGSAKDSTQKILITTPGLVAGTYTINSAVATGGNNFQTFTDAINHITCGINGPVVFNVAPGSGPYTDQVIIPAISGTSATNTITFNGNGCSIEYAAPNSLNRTAFQLKGTDHVIIDSLTIDVSGGTNWGWCLLLSNQADSNVIRNCTFRAGTASTSSNFACIVFNGLPYQYFSGGNNANYNQIIGNNIIGGAYGVYAYGNGYSNTQNNGNLIENNTIQDFYAYGVNGYAQSNSFVIRNNDISRPSRATASTTYGIGIFGSSASSMKIERNRIHNLFDAIPNNSFFTYGIYTSARAKAGYENKVVNNAIYNINNNGATYALANSSADSTWFYNNTVVLDDQNTTTGAAYGIQQTSSGTNGSKYKNNIIVITRSGTGKKVCISIGASALASNTQSDNNILYLNAASGSSNFVGQWGTATFSTLADWQTANNHAWDQVSRDFNPALSNPTANDFEPTNPLINGIGANVGITEDINLKVRDPQNPDPGAWEVNITACSNPPIAGATIVSNANVCPNTNFTLNLTGNTIGQGQTYQWERSANGLAGTWSTVGAGSTTPVISAIQQSTNYYRCKVQCNGGAGVYSTPVMITTPSSVSGVFTINNQLPSSPTNFQNFSDAINFITCGGMGGPIVLNVEPNTIYTDRIYIPQILGMSSVNTLTINGNGSLLSFNSTDNNNRAAVTLDGADYVTIDNLSINASKGTYGWGVLLTNSADNNIISNCTISTSSDIANNNYIGILINGSTTGFPQVGNCANNCTFSNNNITGGYYGVYLYGNSASPNQNINNKVIGNTISEFYSHGVYATAQYSGLIISKNDISRPARSNTAATNGGINISNGCTDVLVEKNRIHSMFDGQISSTSTFQGIFVSARGKSNAPIQLVNNAIYDINSSGPIYGIYNSGGDTMLAYHNTIALDNANGAGTATIVGFYQTNIANGIVFKNNLISITRASTGLKRIFYFNAGNTSNIKSDNNLVYLKSAGNNNHIGTCGLTIHTKLPSWQTSACGANDLLSIDTNPTFSLQGLNAGNFIPTNTACNSTGAALNIAQDILGNSRSVTTPDAGAFEWEPALPVTLVNFTGKQNGSNNILSWITANELNNSGFEIQRSANNREFVTITFVKSLAANGTTKDELQYTYTDFNILPNINYYRLKQIDKNGIVSYSKVVALQNKRDLILNISSVYPNPANGSCKLMLQNSKDENIEILITDIVGKNVMNKKATTVKGDNLISLDINGLSSGIYFIKAINTDGKLSNIFKLVKN